MADRLKYFTIFATMFLVMPIYTLFHELGHAIFAGIGLLMCYYTSGSFINRIFNGITWSALIQLFMTIIPMKYKSGSYNGMISDGKRIMNVLKGKA